MLADVNEATIATTPEQRLASRADYVARINRAIDHIERNLDRELTLEELAKQACFSPFHFHRVFGAMVGETVARFVLRVRLERAASLLVLHPRRSVTEVAMDCGFSSPAVFARAFKQHFGMSASRWRAEGHKHHKNSNHGVCCDIGDAFGVTSCERTPSGPLWKIRCPGHDHVVVRIETLQRWRVAYVRRTGRYQGLGEVFEEMFTKLAKWAMPRGLMGEGANVLAVYHDDPGVTDDDRLRVSACVTVPDSVRVDGEVGAMVLDGGTYAIGRFLLGEKDYANAWFAMMGAWMPESGYEPDDRACFEWFHHDCAESEDQRHAVDICVPVRACRY